MVHCPLAPSQPRGMPAGSLREKGLARLWTANDPSTRTLMEHFYRYLAGGEDKGSALRHSQLDLIAEFGDRALPFYWAGFIIVGDGFGKIPVSHGVVPLTHAAATPARK